MATFYSAGERRTRRRAFRAAGMELRDRAVECLIAEDLEGIAARFEQMYEECVANVKKVTCRSSTFLWRRLTLRSPMF